VATSSLHLQIRGRVQGVGFRFSLAAEAENLGLHGWVRNCRDGSVEAVVRGSDASCVALSRWAHRGPPSARVDRVEVRAPTAAELALNHLGFTTLPTA
jgi:acylphosphatase